MKRCKIKDNCFVDETLFIKQVFSTPANMKGKLAMNRWLAENLWFGIDMKLTLRALEAIEKIKRRDEIDHNSPGFWYALDYHLNAMHEFNYVVERSLN